MQFTLTLNRSRMNLDFNFWADVIKRELGLIIVELLHLCVPAGPLQ